MHSFLTTRAGWSCLPPQLAPVRRTVLRWRGILQQSQVYAAVSRQFAAERHVEGSPGDGYVPCQPPPLLLPVLSVSNSRRQTTPLQESAHQQLNCLDDCISVTIIPWLSEQVAREDPSYADRRLRRVARSHGRRRLHEIEVASPAGWQDKG